MIKPIRKIVLPLHGNDICLHNADDTVLFAPGQLIMVNQFQLLDRPLLGVVKAIDHRRGILYYVEVPCPMWRRVLWRIGTLLCEAGKRMREMSTE